MCHVEIHSWCYAWLCKFTPTWCWPRVFTRLQRVLVLKMHTLCLCKQLVTAYKRGKIVTWGIELAHLPLDKIVTILQPTLSNAFLWMKSFVFWFEFHWSLFLRVQLTYAPRTTKFLGVYTGFTPSVRPSIHPAFCVCSVAPTVHVGSISYLYILLSNFRRCVVC